MMRRLPPCVNSSTLAPSSPLGTCRNSGGFMRNFNFQNPTRILFGRGQIENIADEIPADARILLVAGSGSIRENGVFEQVTKALAGRTVHEFWGVSPNPDIAALVPALSIVRQESIDFVLAVGGGSVIDGAKLIA